MSASSSTGRFIRRSPSRSPSNVPSNRPVVRTIPSSGVGRTAGSSDGSETDVASPSYCVPVPRSSVPPTGLSRRRTSIASSENRTMNFATEVYIFGRSTLAEGQLFGARHRRHRTDGTAVTSTGREEYLPRRRTDVGADPNRPSRVCSIGRGRRAIHERSDPTMLRSLPGTDSAESPSPTSTISRYNPSVERKITRIAASAQPPVSASPSAIAIVITVP